MERGKYLSMLKEYPFLEDVLRMVPDRDLREAKDLSLLLHKISVECGDREMARDFGRIHEEQKWQHGRLGYVIAYYELYFAITAGEPIFLGFSWDGFACGDVQANGKQLAVFGLRPDYVVKVKRNQGEDEPRIVVVIYKMSLFDYKAYCEQLLSDIKTYMADNIERSYAYRTKDV